MPRAQTARSTVLWPVQTIKLKPGNGKRQKNDAHCHLNVKAFTGYCVPEPNEVCPLLYLTTKGVEQLALVHILGYTENFLAKFFLLSVETSFHSAT